MDLKEMVLSALSDLQTQEAARRASERPLPPEKSPEPEEETQAPTPSEPEPQQSEDPKPPKDSKEPTKGSEEAPKEQPPKTPAPSVEQPAADSQEAVGQEMAHLAERIERLMQLQREEKIFLGDLKERLLVLFEGLQSPNNKQIEAKVDLILNFLEYLLATTEERLESLDRD